MRRAADSSPGAPRALEAPMGEHSGAGIGPLGAVLGGCGPSSVSPRLAAGRFRGGPAGRRPGLGATC